MPALGYPVAFKKSSALFQGSGNVRALTIEVTSQPSLKYFGLSVRMLKEQSSLQRGVRVYVSVHIYTCLCVYMSSLW